MPAKDQLHDTVVQAFIKEGWEVKEQYSLRLEERRLWVDLYATQDESNLAIVVEVKALQGRSPIDALASAVGKYIVYRSALAYLDIAVPIYLAVPIAAYRGILNESIGKLVRRDAAINLVVFDPEEEVITQWIPAPSLPSAPN